MGMSLFFCFDFFFKRLSDFLNVNLKVCQSVCRYHRTDCKCNRMQSSQTNARGTPAGLILGPLLFTGFPNDGTIVGADLWLALIFRQRHFHLQSSSKVFNPANEFAVSAKKDSREPLQIIRNENIPEQPPF